MPARRNAVLFLVGLALSMTSLSIAGADLVPSALLRNFVRFHARIGIEYNFFPTAHDIRAILETDTKPSVTVIVGGTSVFQGTSQSEPQIWTEHLQQNLGSKFRVINLAQRAGRPNDFGNLAAEMLLKQGTPVIYVCDSMTSQFTIPIEASFYQKTVFDAWQRGDLLEWPARDRKMSNAMWSSQAKFRLTAWGALADRVLNFNGFWSYVAYQYGGSIWNKYLTLSSIEPLRLAADPELPPQWYVNRGYPTGAANEQELKNSRAQIFPPGEANWRIVRDGIDEQFPAPLRANTLTVVDLNSPHYLDQMTADERGRYVEQAEKMAALIKTMGFHDAFIAAKDFTEADYSDRVHLSVDGGRKLADLVAPEVARMAAELGYVE
jgi:hypothetical protein